MVIHKFLTRKGWRVVAHSLLATAGMTIVYLLAEMLAEHIKLGYTFNWLILGVGIALSLCLVALGSMLAKAELTDWR